MARRTDRRMDRQKKWHIEVVAPPKKLLFNLLIIRIRRNLININNETKHNFSKNNKIFINENLTRTNESIAWMNYLVKVKEDSWN